MKYLLAVFIITTVFAETYVLKDKNNVILQTFVATPEVAATYPACVQQIYPTAVTCEPYTQPTVNLSAAIVTNNVSTTTTSSTISITTKNSQ